MASYWPLPALAGAGALHGTIGVYVEMTWLSGNPSEGKPPVGRRRAERTERPDDRQLQVQEPSRYSALCARNATPANVAAGCSHQGA